MQLVPYQVEGQVLLASSVLIPLPEASAYTVKRERKHQQAQDEEVERYQIRRRFWSGLIEQARERGTSHGNLSPTRNGWIGAGSGTSGIAFNYVVWQHTGAAELYIDRGDRAENKRIFDELAKDREAIEAIAGELQWDRLDAKRAARIRTRMVEGGWRDDADWPDVQRGMIDLMEALEQALRPRIAKLSL